VRAHLRRLVRQIRRHWPKTVITFRGDSHYGRWEAMEWCEQNGVQYVFGLSKNTALDALVRAETAAVEAHWGGPKQDVTRDYTETLYAAEAGPSPAASWPVSRRRIKVSTPAMSSPTSATVPRSGSTTASIARAARRRRT
jgi:hypothetical protein